MADTLLLPIGARVRLHIVQDFLTLRSPMATVLGTCDTPGLIRIRLDVPALCHFEPDEEHEVTEIAEAIENLELLSASA